MDWRVSRSIGQGKKIMHSWRFEPGFEPTTRDNLTTNPLSGVFDFLIPVPDMAPEPFCRVYESYYGANFGIVDLSVSA
jgi:hypothetical protein